MDREALLADARGKRAMVVLLTERVDAELLDAAGDRLQLVANYAVGLDNVDIAACTERNVMVTNTPDVLTEATADMAWALMLAAARRIAEGDRLLRSTQSWIWGPEMMLGHEVYGRTLGVVGFGRIGRAVARRAEGFSMRVLANGRSLTLGTTVPGTAAEAVSLPELLALSDFVSLHVDLNSETWHLITAERLAQMKPTAVLVNTSRGPVVDEEALATALSNGTVFAAGLDVFEWEPAVSPRLLENPNAVVCPHMGSATVDTRTAMGMLAADNLLAALRGERPPSLVNREVWRRARP